MTEQKPALDSAGQPGPVASGLASSAPSLFGSHPRDLIDSRALSDPTATEMISRKVYLLLFEKRVNGVKTRAWRAIAQLLEVNAHYDTASQAIHEKDTSEAVSEETGDREKLGKNDAGSRKPFPAPTCSSLHSAQANSVKESNQERIFAAVGWNAVEGGGIEHNMSIDGSILVV